MMRPVVIAASHSRTYRSFSPADAAISELVDGGSEAITSKRPVRWPMLTISASPASFHIRIIRLANSSEPESGISPMCTFSAQLAVIVAGLKRLLLLGDGSDERSAALPGDDQAALPQDLHRVPDGLIRHAVFFGQGALGRKLVLDLTQLDPGRDVVCDLDIREVRTQRVYHRHADQRRRSTSCVNLS